MATTSQAVERASVARPSTATTEPAVRMDAPTRRERSDDGETVARPMETGAGTLAHPDLFHG